MNPEIAQSALKIWHANATERERAEGPTDDDLVIAIINSSGMTHEFSWDVEPNTTSPKKSLGAKSKT